jgi:hypothetical protein
MAPVAMDLDRHLHRTDTGRRTARGTDAADALGGSEWRWRNYTDHLEDLGYELHGASAADEADGLTQAIEGYRRRAGQGA